MYFSFLDRRCVVTLHPTPRTARGGHARLNAVSVARSVQCGGYVGQGWGIHLRTSRFNVQLGQVAVPVGKRLVVRRLVVLAGGADDRRVPTCRGNTTVALRIRSELLRGPRHDDLFISLL